MLLLSAFFKKGIFKMTEKRKGKACPYHAAEGKYKVTISKRKPVVIRLDAMHATKTHRHELSASDAEHDGFCRVLQETALYLSKRFCGIAFCTADEISLICMRPPLRYRKQLTASRIGSLIGQVACLKFASLFKGTGNIKFDAKVFSLSENAIDGYIKYRRKSGRNTQVTYIAKDYIPEIVKNGTTMEDMTDALKNAGYRIDEYAWNGKLFKRGEEITETGN